MSYYIFDKANVGVQSIIHTINLTQGKDLVGIELGSATALSLCTLAQRVNNLKMVYGVDPYVGYIDFLKDRYDGMPAVVYDEKQMHFSKITAEHNIKYSGVEDKIKLIQKTSSEVVNQFEDLSLDFIYIDCYSTPEQMMEELERWYPKIKIGGLFSGHDAYYQSCYETVLQFRKNNGITKQLSVFDDVFVWIK